MKQIICSGCGFRNFAISAYCGRCEKSLRGGTDQEVEQNIPQNEKGAELLFEAPTITNSPPAPETRSIKAPLPLKLPEADQTKEEAPAFVPRRTGSLYPHLEDGKPKSADSKKEKLPPAPPAPPASPRPRRRRTTSKGSKRIVNAGPLRQGAAQLIDFGVVVLVGTTLFGGLLRIGYPDLILPESSILQVLLHALSSKSSIPIYFVFILLATGSGYSFLGCLVRGFTLGRWATGIVLISEEGIKLSLRRALLRATLATVSALLAGWGFLWFLVDSRGRSLHDVLTKTAVVEKSLLEA